MTVSSDSDNMDAMLGVENVNSFEKEIAKTVNCSGNHIDTEGLFTTYGKFITGE